MFFYPQSHAEQSRTQPQPFPTRLYKIVDIISDPNLSVTVHVKEFNGNNCAQ